MHLLSAIFSNANLFLEKGFHTNSFIDIHAKAFSKAISFMSKYLILSQTELTISKGAIDFSF